MSRVFKAILWLLLAIIILTIIMIGSFLLKVKTSEFFFQEKKKRHARKSWHQRFTENATAVCVLALSIVRVLASQGLGKQRCLEKWAQSWAVTVMPAGRETHGAGRHQCWGADGSGNQSETGQFNSTNMQQLHQTPAFTFSTHDLGTTEKLRPCPLALTKMPENPPCQTSSPVSWASLFQLLSCFGCLAVTD